MPRRSSNADRIARAAAEAEATENDKAAKKAAKKTAKKATKPRSRAAKAPPRMKMVWLVGKPGYTPVATYGYKDLQAAHADAAARGEEFRVAKARVPMDDDE